MLKFLKRTIAAASLTAALLYPLKSKGNEFRLLEPNELQFGNSELLDSGFTSYGNLDYRVEDGFSLAYDGRKLSVGYGELTYTTGEEGDFMSGLLAFANSTPQSIPTPLDNIMDEALRFPEIRNQMIGRFSLQDMSTLFRSFHGLFDTTNVENLSEGEAHLRLSGRLDLQQYSRMRFINRNNTCFFEHGTRVLGYGDAHAQLSYSLFSGEDIHLGTDYDEFLNKRLELSIDAQYKAGHLVSDSYRIGVEENNSIYGLGLVLSRFGYERGFERARLSISSDLAENIPEGRIGYLNSSESNYRARTKGEDALVYFFHAGQNGLVWHSAYFGLDFPDYIEETTHSHNSENLEIALSREVTRSSESNFGFYEEEYKHPRLAYGLLLGIGQAPFQPVMSLSRLNDSWFAFNFTLPYSVFNIASDLELPHYLFLTADRSNEEFLASFIRTTEENSSLPISAPNAMNDYARLNAYSNLDNLTLALSSENEALAASMIYGKRRQYFLELGGYDSSIGNEGLFLRGGVPAVMLTLNYSYGNTPSTDSISHGFGLQVTGRGEHLFYNLSAKGMLISPSRNYQYELDERYQLRTELAVGGNF